MQKRYTRKQLAEAIAYWKKQLRYGNFLTENQYSHKFELETALQLRNKILVDSVGNSSVVFENASNADMNLIIKSFKKFNTLLVKAGEIPVNGLITLTNNINDYIVDPTSTDIDQITFNGLTNMFEVAGVRYNPVNCAVLLTGDSSYMSDCYVVFQQNKRVKICGIELKNSLGGILFSASASIQNMDQLNNIVSSMIRKEFLANNNYSNPEMYSQLTYASTPKIDSDSAMSPDVQLRTLAQDSNSEMIAIEKLLDNVTTKLLNNLNLVSISFTKRNLTKSYTNQEYLDDIKADNINLLMNKLKYELKVAMNIAVQNPNEPQSFLQSFYDLIQHNNVKGFTPLSYTMRLGNSSEVIIKYYKRSSRIRTVEIDGNELIKDHFNTSRTDNDTYKPVYYIQTGKNMNYQLYYVTGNDPLELNKSKFKPGNIDDIYFGVNVEWGVRSDNTSGNRVRYDAKIYPQLTRRSQVGSITDISHQVKTFVQIDNGWKQLMKDIGGSMSTDYTSL